MHFCYWISTAGRVRNVKNLGWILRHWRDVASAEWQDQIPGRNWSGRVTVRAKSGAAWASFQTDWACLDVFLSWMHRPVFRGLPLLVNGQKRLA
jgi:hypothetical protein